MAVRCCAREARCCWLVVLSALGVCAGCESTGWHEAGGVLHDDVVAIHQYYMRPSWFRDEEGEVSGVRVRTYFLPAVAQGEEMAKGVFVPGTIEALLYQLAPRPDGTDEYHVVHQWSFDRQAAMGFRVRKRSLLGESYGFYLKWPPELNLRGRQIMIEFRYERRDGQVVRGRGARLLVPGPPASPAPSSSQPAGRRES